MPNPYVITPTTRQPAGSNNKRWLWLMAVLVVWLILGGLYLIQQSRAKQPRPTYQTEEVTPIVNQPTENVNANSAGLPSAATREQTEAQLPESFLGYIRKVETQFGNSYILIDYIEWLTGDDAKQAALDAGTCSVLDTCAPLGYFVRNASTLVKRFRLSPAADIRMQTLSKNANGGYNVDEKISFNQFLAIFTPDSEFSQWASVPYQVKVQANDVVEIREKFVPR